MVVLDTDVLIDYSKNKDVVSKVNSLQRKERLCTTVLNADEFLAGLLVNGNEEEIFLGREMLKRLTILEYTFECAETVAEIYVNLKNKGQLIGKYDQAIAGICIKNNEKLLTLNKKHFKKVKDLTLV
jgi:tRNA(fMet)-specific endonuclease VapC